MQRAQWLGVLIAAGFIGNVVAKEQDAPPPEPKAAEVIREMGLEEGGPALREQKGWKRPRKIVMTRLGDVDSLKAMVPGVEIVVVNNAAEMAAQAAQADALFSGDNTICDDAVLAAAKQVRWLMSYSAGVEACLGKPKLESGAVVLTNMRALSGPVMAEHVIAVTYALARGLQVSIPRQANGEWNGNYSGSNPQSMTDKTMLIAGLGGIGLEVAKRAHGLGMKVIATRGSSRDKPDFVEYVGLSDELPQLIGKADVVVAALPLTPQTTNLFDAAMFARMKKNAYFVNVGRGGSVVTNDLVAALNNGTIAGASLDVTEPEPLPKGHALWKAKNVIITPHMSGRSEVVGQSSREIILREQVRRFVAGDKLLSVVDIKKGY